MKHWAFIAALTCAPLAAFADQPETGTPPPAALPASPAPAAPTTAAAPSYAAPVETFRVSGARAKMFEMGEAAGGYSVIYRAGQGGTLRLGAETRSSYRNIFRFTDASETELLTGVCRIRVEGQSAFGIQWDQRTSQLYACEIKDKPAERYSLEVVVPAFKQGGFSIGGFSMEASEDVNDPALQAILKARMVYDGVAYEAAPTAFDNRNDLSRRVVQGYAITRDGALVGRIELGRDSFNRGSITAPAAEADGKQAVLFFAQQLSIMPDMYSSRVRSEIYR